MSVSLLPWTRRIALVATVLALQAPPGHAQTVAKNLDQIYEHQETRELVALVNDASELIRTTGESVFSHLRAPDSRWRRGEAYVFVLDPDGNMLVHPDPTMEGKNELGLKDINGRPIIRGLIDASALRAGKSEGWYHYEWPVPGGILPRWKSSYVRRVTSPAGKTYVVGSGVYNDRMERSFVVNAVEGAASLIEKEGRAAFPRFHDKTGPFIVKDTYVFVFDMNGVDLVNPAFPNLQGRNQMDLKDTQGKPLIREMFDVVRTSGSGWVDYMWPKPGESVSTKKSTFVSKAKLGDQWVLVGCGVYLADAPKGTRVTSRINAAELMALVREGAAALERQGDGAYPMFMERGSKWFRDNTYLFVWTMDGDRVFHAADPESEGQDVRDLKDILGRPYGRMFLETAASASGEGWVHYMRPEPEDIFPIWKSAFVKRVTFPSGKQHLVGSGIYNMQMDRAFVEDVVDRAAALVEARGKAAFAQLRDKTGPFVFLDTYVFVDTPEGVEIVNPAQPSLEGMSLKGLKDANGKTVADDYIAAAMNDGSAWVEYFWYRPGQNTPAKKRTFVRKVKSGPDTYIVGSGFYVD